MPRAPKKRRREDEGSDDAAGHITQARAQVDVEISAEKVLTSAAHHYEPEL